MRLCEGFILVLVLSVVTGRSLDTTFCNRGFRVAAKYHTCWVDATYANKYSPPHGVFTEHTAQYVEDYATHMCSVVKPVALECLKEEVAACSNAEKIYLMADDSGGACLGNKLNPFFKQHIIDHLVSVKIDSPCFDLADKVNECYNSAADKIINSQMNVDDLSRFHKVADRFFDATWSCHIKVFKSNHNLCPNWQLPMLLTLQKAAMSSLFGMRLTNDQVARLEFYKTNPLELTTTLSPTDNCETENVNHFYILLKVLLSKPDIAEGDIVLQVDKDDGQKPEIIISQGGNKERDKDVSDFLEQIQEEISSKEVKNPAQLKKEQNKKNKEIRQYLKQLQQSRNKGSKPSRKKGKAITTPRPQQDSTTTDSFVLDQDSMID